jgi:hypothetical protein
MGRQFVVLAALAAFMVSMSACKCPTPAATSAGGDAKSASGGGDGSNKAATAGTSGGGTVCLDAPSAGEWDGTSCYRSEVDRDMANLADCSPHDGNCAGCGWTTQSCEQRMPGTHRSTK